MALKSDKINLEKDMLEFITLKGKGLNVETSMDSEKIENVSMQGFAGSKFEEPVEVSRNYYKVTGSNEMTISGRGEVYLELSGDVKTMIRIKPNALVKVFYKVVEGTNADLIIESENNSYLENYFDIDRSAKVLLRSLVFGSRYFKSEGVLDEESKCVLKGRYLSSGKESICYIFNQLSHVGPNSISEIDVKGVSQDGARVINDGEVKISSEADDTKSDQVMKNFLKGEGSTVESEPMLDVSHNQIECSHSSSISRVEEEAVRYMESRGVDREEAEKMILKGIFEEVVWDLDNSEKFLERV